MTTKRKVLYYKEYESPVAYGYKAEHKVKSYIKITAYFDFKEGLGFTAEAPNVSFGSRNPIKAILRLLEHESIGMSKYNRLKDDSRSCGLWNKLDCK